MEHGGRTAFEMGQTRSDHPISLWGLGLLFLKLGAIGFGGGMAVVALMERECVRRRRLVRSDEFLHGVGLGQILGSFAVNTALFIGYRQFGVAGGILASTAFMTPSVLMVIGLSWLYFTFHTIPSLQGTLTGLGPVVIALILSAAWSMGKKALRSSAAIMLAVLSASASLMHVGAFWILLVAGLAGLIFNLAHGMRVSPKATAGPLVLGFTLSRVLSSTKAQSAALARSVSTPASGALANHSVAAVSALNLAALAWFFLKVGFIFFGGGFVLIPVLHHHLVDGLHWLSVREFLDGVAISQLTPGPIAVLATFAGYRVAGALGAVCATIALFLPSVLLMLLIAHHYHRLHNFRPAQNFLAGIAPAAVGLIAAAAFILAPGDLHLHHPLGILLAVVALYLLVRRRWHPAFVLLLGAVVGTLLPGWLA